VIAGGGLWFNRQQRERELEIAREQREREVKISEQRAQDEALQAYLDELTLLLVTKHDQGQKLMRMQVDDEVRQVIQARSEPLLRSFSAPRRWSLILFLSVMGLLTRERPFVSLVGTDLRGIDGRGAPLESVDLRGANLSGADLSEANLPLAILAEADLVEADLSKAYLVEADLSKADLTGADLREANLRGARLDEAILEGADLTAANLIGTDLPGANLIEAKLSGIKVRGATNASEAIMPDGTLLSHGWHIEDWLRAAGLSFGDFDEREPGI